MYSFIIYYYYCYINHDYDILKCISNPQENTNKEQAFELVYWKQLPKMSKITKRKYVEQEVMEFVVPTGNQQIVKVRWWPLLLHLAFYFFVLFYPPPHTHCLCCYYIYIYIMEKP